MNDQHDDENSGQTPQVQREPRIDSDPASASKANRPAGRPGEQKAQDLVEQDRRRKERESRRSRVSKWLSLFPHLAAEAGLVVRESHVEHVLTVPFDHQGVKTTLISPATKHFGAIDVNDQVMDDPEEAASLLTLIGSELAQEAGENLAAAQDALAALVDTVMHPETCKWVGGEDHARSAYLSCQEQMRAAETVLWADKKRREVLADAGREKLKVAGRRIRILPDARMAGRTLKNRYRGTFPFRSGSIVLDHWVEKALSSADLEKILEADDPEIAGVVDLLLSELRLSLVARLQEQIGSLAKKIGQLPHVDLLSDVDIIRVVAPYYAGLDKTLKKRRARSALVAVEERAREAKYREDVTRLEEHRDDYADVASYYPLARSMDRKLVLYVGPTNSGKTWRAMNDLAQGETGAYLAPLRLLALEGQEELEKRGRITSYITGEERDIRPEAKFTSSTIEMMDFETPRDGVVIDEVQLLADERRGWAWLAAFLGAPAKRVIMTGSPDCIEIVKWLADYLKEPLEIVECQRYNELHVASSPLRIKDLAPGTAVVCFSRREVLRLKELIEATTKHRVAVVYGNLSPQVRREEARRFRDGESDVLVATDAIAMGLNLPIREVVFSTTEKFDGESVRPLTPSEIKQIGGRAGRYGFAQFGVVSALSTHDLALIRTCIKTPLEPLQPLYYVAPGPNHVSIVGRVLGTESLERILTFFERAMEFSDERFARASIDELSYLSTFVDAELDHMTPAERLGVAVAPVDLKSETVLGWFLERMLPCFTLSFREPGRYDPLDDLFDTAEDYTHSAASGQMELRRAEDYLKTLTVYAWLAYRYPKVFPRIEDCQSRRETVNAFVERSLRSGAIRRCSSCGTKLPAGHAHKTCEKCFAKRRDGGGWGRRRQ
jgi:ATP-dependent RNA helicase SUPV3L1/SUV3